MYDIVFDSDKVKVEKTDVMDHSRGRGGFRGCGRDRGRGGGRGGQMGGWQRGGPRGGHRGGHRGGPRGLMSQPGNSAWGGPRFQVKARIVYPFFSSLYS